MQYPAQSTQPKWFLATTKPKEEKRAQDNLEAQQIKCYLPTINVEKIKSGKKVCLEEALFPGYIFIHIAETDPLFSKIRSTRGIRNWVRFEGRPAQVRDELIESLKTAVTKAPVVSKLPEPGSCVRIANGPFTDLEAIFVKADGLERCIVLLDVLGKQQQILLNNKDISI